MNDTSISNSNRDSAASETEITLGVLDAVHANASVTQRSVAQDVGIALGLANAYPGVPQTTGSDSHPSGSVNTIHRPF